MKYTLTGNEVVQIAESSGVIQNASIFDLIISYYEDFRDFYILYGWKIVPFAKRLYVKTAPRDTNAEQCKNKCCKFCCNVATKENATSIKRQIRQGRGRAKKF